MSDNLAFARNRFDMDIGSCSTTSGSVTRNPSSAWNDPRFRFGLTVISSVTENGFAVKDENNMSLEDALTDTARKNYYEGNLNAILAAVNEEGVDVKAYFAWSTSLIFPSCSLLMILYRRLAGQLRMVSHYRCSSVTSLNLH